MCVCSGGGRTMVVRDASGCCMCPSKLVKAKPGKSNTICTEVFWHMANLGLRWFHFAGTAATDGFCTSSTADAPSETRSVRMSSGCTHISQCNPQACRTTSLLGCSVAELWPHCQPLLDSDNQEAPASHVEEQNLALCQEVDSLLAGLQSSWHTLHQHSQACSVLGLTPGIPPCSPDYPPSMPMYMSGQPHNPQLPLAPKSTQQQRQQSSTQSECLHPGAISTDGISCNNKSPTAERTPASKTAHAGTQTIDASQPLLFPGPILTHPSGQQQQHQPGHDSWPPQQRLGPVDQSAKPDELLVPPQEATQGLKPGSWLGGGVLLDAQRLWRELIYDTQVVSTEAAAHLMSTEQLPTVQLTYPVTMQYATLYLAANKCCLIRHTTSEVCQSVLDTH